MVEHQIPLQRSAAPSVTLRGLRTVALVFSLGVVLLAGIAHADVAGQYPDKVTTFKVYGRAVQMGASLVTNFTDYRFNDKLKGESQDKIVGVIPKDAIIKGAYLFWGASAVMQGVGLNKIPLLDKTVTLTTADGVKTSVQADTCRQHDYILSAPINSDKITHYYCRKDITTLLSAHPGADSFNGVYAVGDLNARTAKLTTSGCGKKPNTVAYPNQPETICCQRFGPDADPGCQAHHASWSLVLIYDTAFSETTERDVLLYDGFVKLDETKNSKGQKQFEISGFSVGDPPQARFSYYAMEGDKHLGNPYQDPPGGPDSYPCATCWDFIAFNGQLLSGGAGNNDPHNIFNSTPETSLDLDSFDVSNLIQPGDTSATVLVSSGDGDLSNNQQFALNGSGELILYGYSLLELNRLAPNFKNPFTKFRVEGKQQTSAVPGQVLTFSLDLFNIGDLDALQTAIKLNAYPPPGTAYVPGSTVLDGKVVADIGGQSALQGGLKLGTLTNKFGGDQQRSVSFKFKVLDNPGVKSFQTHVRVNYQYKGKTQTFDGQIDTQPVGVDILTPALSTPELTVSSAEISPKQQLQYTIKTTNTSGAVAEIDQLRLEMPAEVQLLSASGPGVNASSNSGGKNGTGLVLFSLAKLNPGQSASWVITASLKSASDLKKLGISPLHGHLVTAQGSMVIDGASILTDSPKVGGKTDPTVFKVSAPANLTASSKEGVDLSPGTPLVAGDEMQFSITLINSGLGDVKISVTDALHPALQFLSASDAQLQYAGGVVSLNNFTLKSGLTETFVFKVKIKPDTLPNTKFFNAATIVPLDGSPQVTVQTGEFTVIGGPDLSTSLKTVVDLNGGAVEPGDVLRYTITLSNKGKEGSGALQVSDPLDGDLLAATHITAPGTASYDAASHSLLWSVPSIIPGGKATLVFDVEIKKGLKNGTAIDNTAIVSGGELTAPLSLSAHLKVSASPAITTFQNTVTSSDGAPFKPGETVTYTLTVQNTGKGPLEDAALSSSYDPLLQLSTASAGGVITGQKIVWKLGDLAPGAAKTFVVTALLPKVVAQDKEVSNQASLVGVGLQGALLSDDPSVPGQADPTVFKVSSSPDLSASTKTFVDLNGGDVQGGDVLEFTLTVRNDGDAPASALKITDQLDAHLQQVSVIGGSFDATSGTVSWPSLPSLVPGALPISLKFTAVVDKNTPSGTTIANTGAMAFAEQPGSASTNTVSFKVVNLPDFGASTKAASAPQIAAGELVTFTLKIVNSGNLSGSQVVVTDKLAPELLNPQAVGGSVSAGVATWTLGDVKAGQTQTLVITATVKSPLADGTKLCNLASITSKEKPSAIYTVPPGETPAPAGVPTCFVVSSAPKLLATKNVYDAKTGAKLNGGLVKPKQRLRYEISLHNAGNDLASDVLLSDPIDASLETITPLDGGSYDSASHTLSWPVISTLEPGTGAQVSRRFEASVKGGLDNGLKINNQAQITYKGAPAPTLSDDPDLPGDSDKTQVSVVSNIDFSMATETVIDLNGGDPRPGDVLQYTIHLKNDGDAIGKDVVVLDPLDPRLVKIVPQDGGLLSGGKLSWKIGNLGPGEEATLRFKATLKTPLVDGAVIHNQAQITAQGFAAPVLTDSDLSTSVREPTDVKVVAKADLSTSTWSYIDLNGGTIEPSDELVFQLNLRNTGDALALQLAIKALLSSATLTKVKPFDDGLLIGDAVAWTVPSLALSPEGDVTLRFSAQVKPGLANGALITVVGQLPGVTPPPQLVLKVRSVPRLDSSTLAVDDEDGWLMKVSQTGPGHTLRFELTVKNTGKVAATEMKISLPLPVGLEDVQAVTPGQVAGGLVSWNLPTLAAGGTALFVAKAKVAGTLKDGAQLSPSATVEILELQGKQTVVGPELVVFKRPLIKVSKSVEDLSGGHLYPGDSLRFSITASNLGNAPAEALKITDPLGGLPLYDIKVGSGGALLGNTATWMVGTAKPGQAVTVQLEAKVAKGTPNNVKLVNQAFAKPNNGELGASNKVEALVTYPTLALEAVWLPKAGGIPANPGDELALQVTVRADGSLAASDVRVMVLVDATLFELLDDGGGAYDTQAAAVIFDPKDLKSLAQIKVGEAVTVKLTLKVRPTAPHGSVAKTVATAREGETQLGYQSPVATLPIASIPELALSKKIVDLNGGKIHPLDLLRYEIAVSLAGQAAAHDVVITDALDDDLELVAVGQDGQVSADKRTITWDAATTPALALLKPGQKVTLELEVKVRAEVADGSELINQAFAEAKNTPAKTGSDDPSTPAVGDPTLRHVRVSSALEASTKTVVDDNGPPLLPGDTLTWRITLLNTSDAALSGTNLIDPVPAGTTYVAGSTRLNSVPVADLAGGSPLAAGLAISSPGAPAGTLQPGPDAAAIVTFKVRVRPEVIDGTSIDNLATAVADSVPPTSIGPAGLVLGKGPSLRRTDKKVTLLDEDGDGVADVGEALRYEIIVRNDGASTAQNVLLRDPIPAGTHFVVGSLRLNDAKLSDAADSDAGELDLPQGPGKQGQVRVRLGALAAGALASIRFEVRIDQAGVISNQATVQAEGLASELSDSDGDDSNGDQPTIITVGGGAAMSVSKIVQDEDGGDVRAGDWLRYTITIHNPSNYPFENVSLRDILPSGLAGAPESVLLPPGAKMEVLHEGGTGPGTLVVSGLRVSNGEHVTLSLRARIDPKASPGLSICNQAKASFAVIQGRGRVPVVSASSEPACVTLGASVGSGLVQGVLFEDVGAVDGHWQQGQDLSFEGYQILVQPPAGQKGATLSAITDDKGAWSIEGIPAGPRRLRVLSAAGVLFLERSFEQPAGESLRLDLPLSPTGRIYDARTGQALAGVRAYLYYDSADPIAPGTLVPEDALGLGQQGQRTGADGAYIFFAAPGRAYRLDASVGGLPLAFPSNRRAPEAGLALLDKLGMVVPEALPKLGETLPRYFNRFTRQGGGSAEAPPTPRHNHLPVDALRDTLKLSVHLSKTRAQLGEVVHITLTAENDSTAAFTADLLSGKGGVVLRHLLPEGMGYVHGSARATLFDKGAKKGQTIELAKASGPVVELWRATPLAGQRLGLDLPSKGKLIVRLQAVVLPSATTGKLLTHHAALVDPAGTVLGRAVEAKMRVSVDPLFDRGTVIGRVFCDDDGDGVQREGEAGLPAARVYADTGHLADTDRYGRFHMANIRPGNHLFKLDVQTLPPGSTPTTAIRRVLYVTPGVGLKVDFGVRCALDTVGPELVQPAARRRAQVQDRDDPEAAGLIALRGDVEALSLSVDGRSLPAQEVRAAIVGAGSRPPSPLPTPVTPVVIDRSRPLMVRIETKGQFKIWGVELRAVDRHGLSAGFLFERRFNGAPPSLASIKLPAGLLQADAHFVALIWARDRYGASAHAAPIPLQASGVANKGTLASWRLSARARRAQLNGRDVKLRNNHTFESLVQRPSDGLLIVGMRSQDGRRRVAYVSLQARPRGDKLTLDPDGAAVASMIQVGVPVHDRLSDALSKPMVFDDAGDKTGPFSRSQGEKVEPLKLREMPVPKVKSVPPSVHKRIHPPHKVKPAPERSSSAPKTVAPEASRSKVPSAASKAPAAASAASKAPAAKPAAPAAARSSALSSRLVPTSSRISRARSGGKPAADKPTADKRTQWRAVPISFEAAMGVRIAGAKLDPIFRPLNLKLPMTPIPLVDGKILGRLVVSARGIPKQARRAAIVILDREGRVVLRSTLPLSLPETFLWSPSEADAKPLRAGRYGVALEVMIDAPEGSSAGLVGWRSKPLALVLLSGGVGLLPDGKPDKVARANLFLSSGELTQSLVNWLSKTAGLIRERPREIAVVSIHSLAKDADQRTRRAAPHLRQLLLDEGVRRDRLLVISAGAAVPDSDPQGKLLGDDRVELHFRPETTSGSGQPKRFPVAAGLWVGGRPVLGVGNRAPTRVKVRVGEPTLVELQMDEGQASLFERVFTVNPGAAGTANVPQTRGPGEVIQFGAAELDRMRAELDERAASKESVKNKPNGEAKTASAKANKGTPEKKSSKVEVKPMAPPPEPARDSDLAAAKLSVLLPQAGSTIFSERLGVRGHTAPGNIVRVNGQKVLVDRDGAFFALVKLRVGEHTLRISATDPEGNTAEIARKFKGSDRAFFLLAIADTALAQTQAHLHGASAETTMKLSEGLKVHGRGAVYLKGRIQGRFLGFKDIRYTAHLDTARRAELEDFHQELFDPERFYPVYGDSSIDVQDAKARGPLYVMVQADRSKAVLGNFHTGLQAFELLRYDRAMYGAMLSLDKKHSAALHTRAKAYVAARQRDLTTKTDLMRGTGGSLFYLSSRDLLTGSEKVWIIIRDRDNNAELGRIPQRRDEDYTIDYRQGRLIFKSPISSSVDAFFTVGNAGQPGQYLAWNGHSIFVQAEYEARNLQEDAEGVNFGGQLEEELFGGALKVGGTYAHEQRSGQDIAYQLVGGHARLKLGGHSSLRAEYGWSRSRDSLVSVSDDGGLTFGVPVGQETMGAQAQNSGHALGLHLDSDLRDLGGLFGWSPLRLSGGLKGAGEGDKKDPSKASERRLGDFGHLRAWAQWVQAGFHTGGALQEQGQQKVGADARFALSRHNTMALRYDAVRTDSRRDPFQGAGMAGIWGADALANSGSFTPLERQTATLQDSHRLGRFTLLGSAGWMMARDAGGSDRHSETVSGGTAYRVGPRLTLRGEQQFISGGDPHQYRARYLDHFTTVVGGEYKIDKDLSAVLNERVGWGGQNATMAGLRTRLDERSSLYLQQRLEDSWRTGRPVSATVIGAESRYGDDKQSRAYGEYQVDALNAGRMNRAIMGVGKRFTLREGLHVDANYERSQTFSGPVGEIARDALSLGGEWLGSRDWKVSSRQEVRLDRGDKQYGGQRKLQVVSLNHFTARATSSLTLFGRANYLRTENQSLDRLEAETFQGTVGSAWRPIGAGWLNVIGKYTHLIEKRPANANTGVTERSLKHIFAIEPIVELPLHLQWSQKLAWRRALESMADVPEAEVDTLLYIARLGYHLSAIIDLAAEYRFLKVGITGDQGRNLEHGALLEAAWIVGKALRVGAGYNFTRFAETAAGDVERSEGGFYMRLIGMY